jgi:hypothetical protein
MIKVGDFGLVVRVHPIPSDKASPPFLFYFDFNYKNTILKLMDLFDGFEINLKFISKIQA